MTIVTHAADVREDVAHYLRVRDLLRFEPTPQVSRDDVEAVASRLRLVSPDLQTVPSSSSGTRVGLGLREGRTYRLTFSPGVLGARTLDAQTLERDPAPALVALDEDGRALPDSPGRGCIYEWSARSRARMTRAIGELDLSGWMAEPGDLGMVTLTLPGDWLAVAPTGAVFKAKVRAFLNRWRRAIGPVRGLWKLEFQGRGAPHLHMLVKVPALVRGRTFEAWLSETWADVVGADDTVCHCQRDGLGYDAALRYGEPVTACSCTVERWQTERARHVRGGTGVDFDTRAYGDPRRIGVYFAGHSAKTTDGKEYQHKVPREWTAPGAGPGRFWGFWGLERAVVEVDVTAADYDRARRVLRHLARARAARIDAVRAARGLPARRTGSLRSLGSGGGDAGGWVLLNDGVGVGRTLTRWLRGDPGEGDPSLAWPRTAETPPPIR